MARLSVLRCCSRSPFRCLHRRPSRHSSAARAISNAPETESRGGRAMVRLVFLALAWAVAWPADGASTLAPERIYAQELVNQTVASHRELLVVAMHVTPPGNSENVIIASNIGRIGKRADAEDRRVIDTGETLAKVNRNGDRFEVELVLHDASRRPIGALAIVFPYREGDAASRFEEKAAAIRDELAARIPNVASLMRPYPSSPASGGK